MKSTNGPADRPPLRRRDRSTQPNACDIFRYARLIRLKRRLGERLTSRGIKVDYIEHLVIAQEMEERLPGSK